jgi:putative NADPH-quinone reductase
MRVLVVFAHPVETSFSAALHRSTVEALKAAGHEVDDCDLYAEGFEPIRGGDALVAQHRKELASADVLLVFHPNWWSMPPAMVKGWIDRTFVPGVAYRDAPIGDPPIGLLQAKALVFNTGDTPPEREREVFGDPLQRIWEVGVFGFCGIRTVARRLYAPVTSSTPEQRDQWLDEVAVLVKAVAP